MHWQSRRGEKNVSLLAGRTRSWLREKHCHCRQATFWPRARRNKCPLLSIPVVVDPLANVTQDLLGDVHPSSRKGERHGDIHSGGTASSGPTRSFSSCDKVSTMNRRARSDADVASPFAVEPQLSTSSILANLLRLPAFASGGRYRAMSVLGLPRFVGRAIERLQGPSRSGAVRRRWPAP
jgi:hypothetical protein